VRRHHVDLRSYDLESPIQSVADDYSDRPEVETHEPNAMTAELAAAYGLSMPAKKNPALCERAGDGGVLSKAD
jgi:hypothetical protein